VTAASGPTQFWSLFASERMRPRDRLSRARKQDEGVVAIAEESGHPPLLGLDLAPGVPSIGIDGVGGVGAKVLREVAPLEPDLRCPLWLARRQGVEDGHPPMAEPPTVARKVDVRPVAQQPLLVHRPRQVDVERQPVGPLVLLDAGTRLLLIVVLPPHGDAVVRRWLSVCSEQVWPGRGQWRQGRCGRR
jgi:hypothetical protein